MFYYQPSCRGWGDRYVDCHLDCCKIH